MPLKIVFAGTPVFAEKSLSALIQSGHEVIAVYTQPDKPAGRGKKITASPVKLCAQAHDIPVYQPKTLRDPQAQAVLADLAPDVMVVAAYGLILPQAVLDIPKKGCINIHGSILPRWRGAAPIQHAILAGDKTTGITIMQMDQGLDTGDMLLKESVEILPSDTTGSLHDKLATLGANMIVKTMKQMDTFQPEKQSDGEATYAAKVEKQDAEIIWGDTAEQIVRAVRAYHPWPVAYTTLDNLLIKVHQANMTTEPVNMPAGTIQAITKDSLIVSTGEGCLAITQIQLPGKKAMAVKAMLNAHHTNFEIGKQFK